jgi:hypothetical protein
VKFGQAHEWRRIRLAEGSIIDLPDDILRPQGQNPSERGGSVVKLEAAMLRRLLENK